MSAVITELGHFGESYPLPFYISCVTVLQFASVWRDNFLGFRWWQSPNEHPSLWAHASRSAERGENRPPQQQHWSKKRCQLKDCYAGNNHRKGSAKSHGISCEVDPVCCLMPVLPVFKRLKPKDHCGFTAVLGYTGNSIVAWAIKWDCWKEITKRKLILIK